MPAESTTPQTIVLVHGFWVTPRSWEHWIDRFEAAGHRVVAPAYPGFEVEVEAIRADPSIMDDLTATQIVDHLAKTIDDLGLDEQPIIMGHSAGGAFTQLLLDRGYGSAAVVLNSAPTEGVPVTPFSQLKSTFPILKNPANRHRAAGFTLEQWHYAFTNVGFTDEQTAYTYERYAIPAPGGILFGSVTANLKPGHQETWVDYKNDNRAPLLFLSGENDHIMPPSVQRSNAKHYKAPNTITEQREYPGRAHLKPAQDGWEEIADDALAWAIEHARTSTPSAAA
jgi:pimeloyl-ACP methyl ester carboxylesterase